MIFEYLLFNNFSKWKPLTSLLKLSSCFQVFHKSENIKLTVGTSLKVQCALLVHFILDLLAAPLITGHNYFICKHAFYVYAGYVSVMHVV